MNNQSYQYQQNYPHSVQQHPQPSIAYTTQAPNSTAVIRQQQAGPSPAPRSAQADRQDRQEFMTLQADKKIAGPDVQSANKQDTRFLIHYSRLKSNLI
jgi:hypothetical protein